MSSNRSNILVPLLVALIGAIAVIIAGALQGGLFTPQTPSTGTPQILIRQTNLSLSTVPRTIQVYQVNNKDFVAETHLSFSPQRDFEGAGFFVELAQDGRIEFVLAHCSSSYSNCVGRGLYLDVLNTFSLDPADQTIDEVIDYSGNAVYLRLEKSEEDYTASYRNPSSNEWITLATFQDTRDALNVGIMSQTNWPNTRDDGGNNPSDLPAIQARFIEFTLTSTD